MLDSSKSPELLDELCHGKWVALGTNVMGLAVLHETAQEMISHMISNPHQPAVNSYCIVAKKHILVHIISKISINMNTQSIKQKQLYSSSPGVVVDVEHTFCGHSMCYVS